MKNKYLINSIDLDFDEILEIFEKASFYKNNDKKKFNDLCGKSITLAFFEPSTRTKLSFETAAKNLSADVLEYHYGLSSQTKGESLADTLRTLEAMDLDMFVVRHKSSGVPQMLQNNSKKIIINAGDGKHDHPTQSLLDSFTLHEKFGDLKGLNLTIVGDIMNSRVARANLDLLPKLGVHVSICGPKNLIPHFNPWKVNILNNIDEAIAKSDVIMLLRIQKERMSDGMIPSISEYSKLYSMTNERYEKNSNLVLLHPGPVNYGIELEYEVTNYENCLIQKQVTNGVFIRMAVLSILNSN